MKQHHPSGVTIGVWVNDQINRVEKALSVLSGVTITLADLERLEAILTKAHNRNIRRLKEDYSEEELG